VLRHHAGAVYRFADNRRAHASPRRFERSVAAQIGKKDRHDSAAVRKIRRRADRRE
jgi:hypothetical protein